MFQHVINIKPFFYTDTSILNYNTSQFGVFTFQRLSKYIMDTDTVITVHLLISKLQSSTHRTTSFLVFEDKQK